MAHLAPKVCVRKHRPELVVVELARLIGKASFATTMLEGQAEVVDPVTGGAWHSNEYQQLTTNYQSTIYQSGGRRGAPLRDNVLFGRVRVRLVFTLLSKILVDFITKKHY